MSLSANGIKIDAICKVVLLLIKESEEMIDIYKRLTNEPTFINSSACTCSKTSNDPSDSSFKVKEEIASEEVTHQTSQDNITCANCQKMQKLFHFNKAKSVQDLLNEKLFYQCHPKVRRLNTPVLPEFELELLVAIQELCKHKRYETLMKQLLSVLKEAFLTKNDIMTIERLFICRFYASCCRLSNNHHELVSLIVALFQDQPPHLNLSLIFITSYSIWPSIVTRTDLLKVNSTNKMLDLHRIKLSPMSATLQLISLVESMVKKENTSCKTLETLFGIQLENKLCHMNYYQPMVMELFELLCNKEISFAIQAPDNDIKFCPFVFPTVSSIKMLCKLIGWEWTYNELIVVEIWDKLEAWSKNDDVDDNTVVVLMALLGHLCQVGLSCGFSDYKEMYGFLVNFLTETSKDITVSPSVHISILNALLDISPQCMMGSVTAVLQHQIQFGERKNIIIPARLKEKFQELQQQELGVL